MDIPHNIFEHILIIFPSLGTTFLLTMLILRWGTWTFIKLNLATILILLFLLLLWTMFIDFPQFLILIYPLISSYLFTSRLFKRIDLIDKFNFLFLLLIAQVIVIAEGLSLIHGLTGNNFFIGTTIFLLVSLLISKNHKLSLMEDIGQIREKMAGLHDLIKKDKLLGIFLSAVLFSILWRMGLIVLFPTNNSDSMHYHLSRVAYWLQFHSMDFFYSHNMRQVCFPFNSEILFLWTMVSSKMDYLAGFIQFFCYLLSGTLIYKCVHSYLKILPIPSIFITLVWYALPANVLESTTTQNDLVIAYLAMFTLVYLLIGSFLRKDYLAISGIAFGIGLGIKTTMLFFAAGLFIILFLFLFKKTISVRTIFFWALSSIISFFILSSYSYIQNFLIFHNVFGPPNFIAYHKSTLSGISGMVCVFFEHIFNLSVNQTGLQFYIYTLSNSYNDLMGGIGKLLFQLIAVPVNQPGTFALELYINFFYFNNWALKFRIHEDYAYFAGVGFIFFILIAYILMASILNLYRPRKNPINQYLILSILSLGYLLSLSFFKRWDPHIGRLMIPMMLIGIPILGLIFNSKNPFIKRLGKGIVIYSIVLLIPNTFMNELKPLIPYQGHATGDLFSRIIDTIAVADPKIINELKPLTPYHDRAYGNWISKFIKKAVLVNPNDLKPSTPYYNYANGNITSRTKKNITIANANSFLKSLKDGVGPPLTSTGFVYNIDQRDKRYAIFTQEARFIQRFNRLVPARSKVGILLADYQWDYPLFGEKLTREIVPLDIEKLQSENYDYVLVNITLLLRNKEFKTLLLKRYNFKKYLGIAHQDVDMALYMKK